MLEDKVGDVGDYITDFSTIRGCLDGSLPAAGCAGVGDVHKVLMYDGQTWKRPARYANYIRIFYLTLVHSMEAVCGYNHVTRPWSNCSDLLKPELKLLNHTEQNIVGHLKIFLQISGQRSVRRTLCPGSSLALSRRLQVKAGMGPKGLRTSSTQS